MLVEKRDATERLPFQKPLPPIGSLKIPTHSLVTAPGSNVTSDRSLVVHETKGTNHVQDIVERGWGTRRVEYERPESSRLRSLVGTVTGDVSASGSSAPRERQKRNTQTLPNHRCSKRASEAGCSPY